jgi:hypothetical protein
MIAKPDHKIHKMWLKKFHCIRSKTVWDVFHDLKNVKIAEKVLNRSIFATFYEFKSRFEEGAQITYLIFDIF